MKLTKLFASFFLLLSIVANGQDIHFSQFYASPLNLNPATTGVLSCDVRFSAIYRNQWASVLNANAFNTFSAGLETRLPIGKNDFVGVGLNLWADKAGSSAFSTIHGSLSGSFIKRLGGRRSNDMYLSAAGSIGFSQRSIETLKLQFGSQWNGDAFDGTLTSGENESSWNSRVAYADLGAGLFWWMALDKKGESNVYAGMAFNHLTRANISFLAQGFDALYMKSTVHFGGEFRVKKRFALVPNVVLLFQGPSVESNFGTSLKFDFSKRSNSQQAFEIGPWFRMVSSPTGSIASDALILVARIRFGGSAFGLSYDINVSKLSPATRGNGAFELSYVFTLCGIRNRPMGCPAF
jgi:type IX secretion system PorP/SprF family membrane protein